MLNWIYVPPEYMYSDYQNPFIVAWNWSFLPLDVLFAVLGLAARFFVQSRSRELILSTLSLALMFCAGLMAVSFWIIQGSFDPFWWGINIWLMALSGFVLSRRLTALD
ncbi:YvaD family protein [Alphaproteobacteria bacterium]|nr:YvaD family protein [Alphaproteobacteria bacterium]